MSWRDRATVVTPTKLPGKTDGQYVNDIGAAPLQNEADVLKAIDPNNWRNRATPISMPSPEAAQQSAPIQAQPAQLSPAQQMQSENPLLRTLGRGGRAVASGLGAAADVALLPVKTAALGAGLATGNEGLQKFGMIPSMHESTQGVIDQATGDKLKPTGFMDSAFDFGGEMITGAGLSALPQRAASQAPGVIDAVRGVMNPTEVLGNLPQYAVSGQGNAAIKVTSEQIRKQAGEKYKQANSSGGQLKPEFTNKWLDSLNDIGFQDDLVNQMGFTKDKATDVLENLSVLKDKPMTLQRAQDLDEALSNAITYDLGRPTKESLRIIKIQDALRRAIDSADEAEVIGGNEGFEALKSARAEWSKAAKLRDVERIIQRAELMDNPPTALKTGFRNLLTNPNRMIGYTQAQKKAIEQAATSGLSTDVLNVFGSKLIPIGASIAGGSTGGPAIGAGAGVASYALSAASRKAAGAIQRSKAEKVADLIRGNTSKIGPPIKQSQKALAAALLNITTRGQ